MQMEQKSSKWTFEENELFENALADIDLNSPSFLENLASKMPWKSIEDVKNHYQALLDDIETIGSGKVPLPDYPGLAVEDNQAVTMMQQDQPKKDEGSNSTVDPKTRSNGHQRHIEVLWTELEHQLFLKGLNKYGRGSWRSISRNYVISKTPTQVANHAQKYFLHQTSSTTANRRRHNIHDIQTMAPIPTPIPQRSVAGVDSLLPNFQTCDPISPPLNSGMVNGGDPLAPNPMFISPLNNSIMNNNPNYQSDDLVFR
ncbi:hypothetical protein ACS0TY_012128 [Phlomoides rotata]